MGVIGIAIDGAQAAAKRLARFGTDLIEAEKRAVDKAGRIMRNRSVKLVSGEVLNVRTGALRASINKGNVFADQGGYAVNVGVLKGNAEKYAPIQEFGGVIRAKNVPYLKFKTADGYWHSVKSVTIPPHRYLGTAFDEIKPQVGPILADEIRQAIARAQ